MTSTTTAAAEHDGPPARMTVTLDLHLIAQTIRDYQTTIAQLHAEITERDTDIADLTHEFARYRRGTHRALAAQRHRVDVLLRRLRMGRTGAAQ